MLLPSILQLLADDHIQTTLLKNVESGFKAEIDVAVKNIQAIPGHPKVEAAPSADFKLPKQRELETSCAERTQMGQSLEELLRIINKFQKPNPKRMVDFFE
jgi:hypothetical protein